MCRLSIFVSGDEEEAVRVCAHRFVVDEAEHHSFPAVWICTLADEWHPLIRPKTMAESRAPQPLVGGSERRLVDRKLEGPRLLV